ncbi:TetR/AcrR family transcriptional regulator [Azospirillum sp. B4]|uniref:TetR/AcrR family transcriptional regulator n=1 Tax=Azospirillum sp. B4 TaxID=95605 RepID=UPI00034C31BF|nr:helix-turn-helix domain-containing protein [Azospirillum sp. B4]
MSTERPPRQRRQRRSPEEARRLALEAARACLLENGPGAVTLQEVGKRIGMTHVNLIHHFGSAAGLQTALMASMLCDLNAALGQAITRILSDDPTAQREMIDIVFDAYAEGGAAKLAAWIALSGEIDRFEPIRIAVQALVVEIEKRLPPDSELSIGRLKSSILFIALNAFADALIGGFMRETLGREADATRKMVARLLPSFY